MAAGIALLAAAIQWVPESAWFTRRVEQLASSEAGLDLHVEEIDWSPLSHVTLSGVDWAHRPPDREEMPYAARIGHVHASWNIEELLDARPRLRFVSVGPVHLAGRSDARGSSWQRARQPRASVEPASEPRRPWAVLQELLPLPLAVDHVLIGPVDATWTHEAAAGDAVTTLHVQGVCLAGEFPAGRDARATFTLSGCGNDAPVRLSLHPAPGSAASAWQAEATLHASAVVSPSGAVELTGRATLLAADGPETSLIGVPMRIGARFAPTGDDAEGSFLLTVGHPTPGLAAEAAFAVTAPGPAFVPRLVSATASVRLDAAQLPAAWRSLLDERVSSAVATCSFGLPPAMNGEAACRLQAPRLRAPELAWELEEPVLDLRGAPALDATWRARLHAPALSGPSLHLRDVRLDAEVAGPWAHGLPFATVAELSAAHGRVASAGGMGELWGASITATGKRKNGELSATARAAVGRAAWATEDASVWLRSLAVHVADLGPIRALPAAPRGTLWLTASSARADWGAGRAEAVEPSSVVVAAPGDAAVDLDATAAFGALELRARQGRDWSAWGRGVALGAVLTRLFLPEGDLARATGEAAVEGRLGRAAWTFGAMAGRLRGGDLSMAAQSAPDARRVEGRLATERVVLLGAPGEAGVPWLGPTPAALSADFSAPRRARAWGARADLELPGTTMGLDAWPRGAAWGYELTAQSAAPQRWLPLAGRLEAPWALGQASLSLRSDGELWPASARLHHTSRIDVDGLRPTRRGVPSLGGLRLQVSASHGAALHEGKASLALARWSAAGWPEGEGLAADLTWRTAGGAIAATIAATLPPRGGGAAISISAALGSGTGAPMEGAVARGAQASAHGTTVDVRWDAPRLGEWARWIPAEVRTSLLLDWEALGCRGEAWLGARSMPALARPASAGAAFALTGARFLTSTGAIDVPLVEVSASATDPGGKSAAGRIAASIPSVQRGQEAVATGIALSLDAAASERGWMLSGRADLAHASSGVPGYALDGAFAELAAELDSGGVLEALRAHAENPAGGSTLDVEGARVVLGGASALDLEARVRVTQELSALSPTSGGPRGSGRAAAELDLSSARGQLWRTAATLTLEDVTFEWPDHGIAIAEVNGTIPVLQDLARSEDGEWSRLDGPPENPYALVRFGDVHPFLARDHFASAESIRVGPVTVGPLAGNPRIEWNKAAVDQLQARWLGGTAAGRLELTMRPGDPVVTFSGRVGGIRPTSDGSTLDANASLRIRPYRLDAEGRVHILKMSRDHLDALLVASDPFRRNPSVQSARSALALGYPKAARLVAQHGFLTLRLELGGLAELVSLDEIRGVPVGPLLQRLAASAPLSPLAQAEAPASAGAQGAAP